MVVEWQEGADVSIEALLYGNTLKLYFINDEIN